MRTRLGLPALVFSLAVALAACGNGTQLPPASNSNTSAVTITLTTNPVTPAQGQVELIITLTDPTGKPVDNAQVNLLASHKTMSGMNMNGKTTAQGNGRYAVTANFGMNGIWLVTAEVHGIGTDTIRKDFDLSVK